MRKLLNWLRGYETKIIVSVHREWKEYSYCKDLKYLDCVAYAEDGSFMQCFWQDDVGDKLTGRWIDG